MPHGIEKISQVANRMGAAPHHVADFAQNRLVQSAPQAEPTRRDLLHSANQTDFASRFSIEERQHAKDILHEASQNTDFQVPASTQKTEFLGALGQRLNIMF
jgi:hypothetical protein